MAPRGTIWGSFCIVVTLSDIETIWTKFGQNPGFSLRKSVSLTPGPTVKKQKVCVILIFLKKELKMFKIKALMTHIAKLRIRPKSQNMYPNF